MINVYGKCDAFVLPSDFEGMPNFLMEAMACAVPCISTDCETGPSDLIESGRNGILIPVGSKEKMIEALECKIDRPQEAYTMGQKARKTAEQLFSAHIIVERLISSLNGICRSIFVGMLKRTMTSIFIGFCTTMSRR